MYNFNTAERIENMPELLITNYGFKNLEKATPADLPNGALVVIFDIFKYSFQTIVIRAVEKGPTCYKLYYKHQNQESDRVNHGWNDAMISIDCCGNYRYKVIS